MTVLVIRGTLTMAMIRPTPIRKWVRFAPEKVARWKSRGSMRGWGMRFSLMTKPAARAREKDDADGGEGWGVGPAGNGQGEDDEGEHEPEAAEVVDGGLAAGAARDEEQEEQD